jgi:hypothetical protein
MSTETLTAQQLTVTVKSSQGKPKAVLTIGSGSVWKDLKALLQKEGYNMDSLEAVNSFDNNSYNHPEGKLPNQDFRLYLFPRQTKGGMALTRSEAYTKVKGYLLLGEKAVAHFNEGKNYTTKKTDELEVLINKWEKKHGTAVGQTPADKKSTAKVKPSQTAALTPKPKKERVKGAAQGTTAPAVIAPQNCPEITIESATAFLAGITGHENQEHIYAAVKSLGRAMQPKPTKSEDEIMAEEEAFLKSGLTGIKK